MKVLSDQVYLSVTLEEADIIQQALTAWRGSYAQDQLPTLTEGESQRAVWQRGIAVSAARVIQDELLARYEAERADKFQAWINRGE